MLLLISVTVLAVALAGVVVISPAAMALRHADRVRAPAMTSASAKTRIGDISPTLRRHFAIFRQRLSTGRSTSRLPPSLVNQWNVQIGLRLGVARYGPILALARFFAVTATLDVWVIPGRNGVCVVQPQTGLFEPNSGYSSSCGPVADADAGRMWAAQNYPHGKATLFALVPDGNTTISLTRLHAQVASAAVRHNLFATNRVGLRAYTVRTASGTTVRYPIP
jgi:hypothetical protein